MHPGLFPEILRQSDFRECVTFSVRDSFTQPMKDPSLHAALHMGGFHISLLHVYSPAPQNNLALTHENDHLAYCLESHMCILYIAWSPTCRVVLSLALTHVLRAATRSATRTVTRSTILQTTSGAAALARPQTRRPRLRSSHHSLNCTAWPQTRRRV